MPNPELDSSIRAMAPAAKWGNWQAMRFLYEDVNSLLYGEGLDISTFNLDLPALHLPNYFNSFNIIQGQGSTNTNPGNPGSGGGSGGSTVILDCDISRLANLPISYPYDQAELVKYIMTFGEFSMKIHCEYIADVLRSGFYAQPAFGQTIILADGIETQFSVDLCPPPTCSSIRNLSLIFRLRAAVYARGIYYIETCPAVESLNFMSYKLQADYGMGNSFFYEKDPITASPTFADVGGPSFPFINGYPANSTGDVVDSQTDPNHVLENLRNQLTGKIFVNITTPPPTLPSKFKELLALAGC